MRRRPSELVPVHHTGKPWYVLGLTMFYMGATLRALQEGKGHRTLWFKLAFP